MEANRQFSHYFRICIIIFEIIGVFHLLTHRTGDAVPADCQTGKKHGERLINLN